LLEQVGLKASDADKYPTQFSGGELQRVSIARAIAVHPALIVLDEAVSSLDMVTQAHILELLGRLRSELGTAYLFISHDIRILLQATDHLVLLHDGRLTPLNQNMEPEDSSVRPFFQNLIAAVPSPLPPVLADGGTWSPEELIPRTFPVSDQNGP
jgi:ABC-type glutathione transport system ATPase component